MVRTLICYSQKDHLVHFLFISWGSKCDFKFIVTIVDNKTILPSRNYLNVLVNLFRTMNCVYIGQLFLFDNVDCCISLWVKFQIVTVCQFLMGDQSDG